MATYRKKAGKDLKIDLNVSYSGKSLAKSMTKSFSEEIVSRKEVDSADAGVLIATFNDTSFLASSLKDCKGLVICNEGAVSAELTFNVALWAAGTPDTTSSGGGQKIKKLLNAGEFLYMPNIAMIDYGTSNTSASYGATLDNVVPAAALYVDSGVNLDAKLEDDATVLGVADIALFEVGDLVQVGINDTTATRIEVMEVTSITDDSGSDDDAAGNLVVTRGLYGTSLADGDAQDRWSWSL